MKDRVQRIAAGAMLLLLIVSLVPVMYLGRYNHPTGDDYYYGAATYQTWQETGSVVKTVSEAVKGVALEYGRWQGTYSALLLMHLPPNIWGNLPYRWVTTVIILLLTAGIFYLGWQILVRYLKLPVSAYIIICAGLTLLCVEGVPSQGETFFWYNGSMYYTGYFAVSLLYIGLMIRYVRQQSVRRFVLLLLLAVFLAGGNYVTLLPCLILSMLVSGWLISRKSASAGAIAAVALTMLAGLIVSAAAPGNYIRQDGMWRIPAWKAVIKSLVQGVRYTEAWTGIGWILSAFLITPCLWRHFKKVQLRFPDPAVVIGLLYGIFCSMSCPTFYTMNSTGPARAVSVVYYGFVLLSFAAYLYLVGYIQRRWSEHEGRKREGNKVTAEGRRNGRRGALTGCAVILLLGFTVATGTVRECTTAKAVRILASGEARAYEEEYQERYRIFVDDSIQEPVLKPYDTQPDMLYVGDFSADSQDPTNVRLAEYFGKKSVRVEY